MWTYSGDPGSSELDEVRFWVQDTDESFPLLQDEEISYLLDAWIPATGSTLFVAAVAAEVVSARFASEVSVSADGVSVQVSELQGRYERLAAQLLEQYKAQSAASSTPLLTGVMWDQSYDATVKPLVFGVGAMDNYEAGRQDYGDFDPGSIPSLTQAIGMSPEAAGLLDY